jgi:hypothetical protein
MAGLSQVSVSKITGTNHLQGLRLCIVQPAPRFLIRHSELDLDGAVSLSVYSKSKPRSISFASSLSQSVGPKTTLGGETLVCCVSEGE